MLNNAAESSLISIVTEVWITACVDVKNIHFHSSNTAVVVDILILIHQSQSGFNTETQKMTTCT